MNGSAHDDWIMTAMSKARATQEQGANQEQQAIRKLREERLIVPLGEQLFRALKLKRFELADVLYSAFNSRILHQNVQSAREEEC